MRAISPAQAPIGIFDSGLGGLTVAREIARVLPGESLLYVGDTARCPYGSQGARDIQRYVRQICSFLHTQDVKLIVIACNSATATGLEIAQREFDIPVIGVIEPGARAAVRATRNRRIGVIGTDATIGSGVYESALKALDAGCEVTSIATPPFVGMVEEGLAFGVDGHEVVVPPDFAEIAEPYLNVLRMHDVDCVVLGCTHYPLLQHAIADAMGPDVVLVSSAEETARDVKATLLRRGQTAPHDAMARYQFYTTGDCERFSLLGANVWGRALESLDLLSMELLETLDE